MSAISQSFLHWENFFHSLGWLGLLIFALALVALQFFCLPLAPFAVIAGLFFGLPKGFAAVQLGTSLGAALNFLLARYFFRERVTRWLGTHEKFRLIDAAIGREGWKIITLLRLCPIPFGLANYSYALTAVGFLPYLLATVFAIVPANFFFVWFGATSHDALEAVTGGAKAPPGQMAFTVVGLVAFFVALTYVARIARAAIARKDAAAPTALVPDDEKMAQGRIIE
jgi:uncharacterized membrane protein YdjX (TVP38/TMEM64 family)